MKLLLSENLIKLMNDQNISTVYLSRQTGVPQSTIHEWKLNRSPKDLLKLKKIADYFKVTLDWILFGISECEINQENPSIEGEYKIIIKKI